MTFTLSRKAKQDLRHIYLYGANHFGETQANTYAASLKQCLVFLTEHPSAGRRCLEITANMHRHPHQNHLIYYQQNADGILIVRILHRTMDATKQLEKH